MQEPNLEVNPQNTNSIHISNKEYKLDVWIDDDDDDEDELDWKHIPCHNS